MDLVICLCHSAHEQPVSVLQHKHAEACPDPPFPRATVTSMRTAKQGRGGYIVRTRTSVHSHIPRQKSLYLLVLPMTYDGICDSRSVCAQTCLLNFVAIYNICMAQNTVNAFCWPIKLSYIKVIHSCLEFMAT